MFGKRLKDLRIKKGLSQEDIGKFLSLSKQTISSYENGLRNPEPETLIKLAELLNVSVDFLLGRTEEPRPVESLIESALSDDQELMPFWFELKKRPDLQILFKQTKDMSPESIRRIVKIIKAIEDEEETES